MLPSQQGMKVVEVNVVLGMNRVGLVPGRIVHGKGSTTRAVIGDQEHITGRLMQLGDCQIALNDCDVLIAPQLDWHGVLRVQKHPGRGEAVFELFDGKHG